MTSVLLSPIHEITFEKESPLKGKKKKNAPKVSEPHSFINDNVGSGPFSLDKTQILLVPGAGSIIHESNTE